MKCSICDSEMKIGIAINSAMDERAIYSFTPIVDSESIGFIDVMKCVKCGRSLSKKEIDEGVL